MAFIPYFYGNHYYYLLPGVIIYFFSLSIIHAPMNRFCLYVTNVSKGTASALISLSSMIISALGIELANKVYEHHLNYYFGFFSLITIILFLIFIAIGFSFNTQAKESENRT